MNKRYGTKINIIKKTHEQVVIIIGISTYMCLI